MREEVIALPTFEQVANAGDFAVVQTIREVAARLQHLTTTRCAQCALVTIDLQFAELQHHPSRSERVSESVLYFLNNIRSLVRKTDIVLLLHQTLYFVLPDATIQGAQIVQERLWEALLWRMHNLETQMLCPRVISSGYSAYPEPVVSAEQCIMASSIAQKEFTFTPPLKEETPIPQDGNLSEQARRYGVPYVALLPRQLPEKVWQLVGTQLAHELRCCPLGRAGNVLTVAMSDPQDQQSITRLQEATGLNIFPVLAHPRELETVLAQYM